MATTQTPHPQAAFKCGDNVKWTTLLDGRPAAVRMGKIIEVVTAGDWPALPGVRRGVGVGDTQAQESYVVETRDGCFWPPADALEAHPDEFWGGADIVDMVKVLKHSFGNNLEDVASRLEFTARLIRSVDSERELLDPSQHPVLDAIAWRLADAGLIFRTLVENSNWKGVGGVHSPTGFGALLPVYTARLRHGGPSRRRARPTAKNKRKPQRETRTVEVEPSQRA